MIDATKRGLNRLIRSTASVSSRAHTKESSGVPSHSHSRLSSSKGMTSTCGSTDSPSARRTATRFEKSSEGTSVSEPVATWRRKDGSRSLSVDNTAGTISCALRRETTSVLSVLQTLRSREPSTAFCTRSGEASSAAYNHAPPVPCSDTGVPCCAAIAPSSLVVGPDPRATASRTSANVKRDWAAACEGDVARVRLGDAPPQRIIGQALGERPEELRDLFVSRLGHGLKSVVSSF